MGGSTLPLAPDAFSGRKLGKYEVLCRLSTGGMAEIFLASQRGLAGFRKLVVLKQILPDIAGEEEFVQMFLDEAKVTAAFTHPHIAQVYDLDVADGELFLAMEFVPGATLVEVAKACRAANESIPIGFSLETVRDTALALHYAHTFTDPLGRPSPVIHRDVAEKNIMVTYEGVTKLLDFGIAKNLARRGRTQVGMVKGTNGYMSPEQILGEPLDARSDLFSLGVVLHELLTGLRLFHAKTPEASAGAILHGQVPPPSRANKAIPPELDAVVLKALARKREDRFASTLEFARALERAVGPLFWHPEQSAEMIQRLFAERRDQSRQLLMTMRSQSGEISSVVNVAQLLIPAAPPQMPPEPGTIPSLPQITPSLPPTPRPSLAGIPAVKPLLPPSQEGAQPPPPAPSPPTPPGGAITRRPISVGVPAITPAESAALRRAVFEPLPQKRGGAGQPSEPMPPPPAQEHTARTQPGDEPSYSTDSPPWIAPPPPQENTGRTDPGADPSHPDPPSWMPLPPQQETTSRTNPGDESSHPGTASWVDENATRAALPEKPSFDEAEVRARREEPPREEPPREELPHEELPQDDRTRPIRANLHLMATIPMMEGPSRLQSPPAEQNPPEDEDSTRLIESLRVEQLPQEDEDSTRQIRTPVSRVRPALNDRFPMRTSNPSFRSLQRQVPAPPAPPPAEPPELEFGTEPTHGPALGVEEHVEDTNETPLPQIETDFEEGTLVNAPAAATPASERKGGMLLVVLAVGMLLLSALGLVVGLGLDGGRLMGSGSLEPIPVTPVQSVPAPTRETSAPSLALTPAATPAAAAPSEPSPATPAVSGDSLEPAPAPPATSAAAAPSSTSSGAETEATVPPPSKPAAGPPDSEPTDNSLEAVVLETAPPQPSKRSRPPARSASASAPSSAGLLTLVTTPYAKVYLGRRYLGDTPLFKINLPTGKHSLRLVGADGRTLRLPVEIKTGETTALKLTLDEIARQPPP